MGLGRQMLGDRVRGTHTPGPLVSTSQVGDPVTTENKSLFANSPSAPCPSCGGQRAGALLVPSHVEPTPGAPPSARVLAGMGLARHALGCMSSRGPASQPQGQTDRGVEALHPRPPQEGHRLSLGSCRLCPHRCITSQPCPLVTGRQTLGSHQLAACPQAGPCPSSLRPLLLKWGDTNFLRGAINKQGAGRRDVGGAASLAVSLTLQIPCGAVHGRCGDNSLVWRRGG